MLQILPRYYPCCNLFISTYMLLSQFATFMNDLSQFWFNINVISLCKTVILPLILLLQPWLFFQATTLYLCCQATFPTLMHKTEYVLILLNLIWYLIIIAIPSILRCFFYLYFDTSIFWFGTDFSPLVCLFPWANASRSTLMPLLGHSTLYLVKLQSWLSWINHFTSHCFTSMFLLSIVWIFHFWFDADLVWFDAALMLLWC